MRWSWLRAVVLGFMIEPGAVLADPPDLDAADAKEPLADDASTEEVATGHFVDGMNFHVWDEDSHEAAAWAAELLQVGGPAVEAARWGAVAEKTAGLPSMLTDEAEAPLAAWSDAAAEDASLTPLGCVLCLLPGLDRTCLIASWATSSDETTRRALARALAAPFDAVGVRGVLEHLQVDPNPEVRRLAHAAAALRHAPRA